MAGPMTFTIGRLAQQAGLSVQTVRYYETLGLLTPVRRSTSGYRLYDGAGLLKARLIKQAREAGFCLVEIRKLLSYGADCAGICHGHRATARLLLKSRLRRVERLSAELERERQAVRATIKDLQKLRGRPAVQGHCLMLDRLTFFRKKLKCGRLLMGLQGGSIRSKKLSDLEPGEPRHSAVPTA